MRKSKVFKWLSEKKFISELRETNGRHLQRLSAMKKTQDNMLRDLIHAICHYLSQKAR